MGGVVLGMGRPFREDVYKGRALGGGGGLVSGLVLVLGTHHVPSQVLVSCCVPSAMSGAHPSLRAWWLLRCDVHVMRVQ